MQLEVTTDTSTLSYWLNWRVLLCAIWVLISIVIASFFIWQYEGSVYSKPDSGEKQEDVDKIVYVDEAWKPCIKEIHPIWLLVFRVIAFCSLLATLIVKATIKRFGMFYFYTQWTFTLVTIYFGLGSLLSMYGCYLCYKTRNGVSSHKVTIDAELGSYMSLPNRGTTNMVGIEGIHTLHTAGVLAYIFQIIYQMTVNMHTLNAFVLLIDTALNCLRFPWFRIAYFVLWTALYVIFQWVIHACASIWWPYPFLKLSSPYAPLWYMLLALMHIPCYGIFALIVNVKHYLLSKWFPQSYQCIR